MNQSASCLAWLPRLMIPAAAKDPAGEMKASLPRGTVLLLTMLGNEISLSGRLVLERASGWEQMRVTENASLLQSLRNQEGKGTAGCLLFILVAAIAVFLAIRIGPTYYANKSFEADLRTEVSRAGANFLPDEAVLKNVIDLARRNEIRLRRENVKVERFAGQMFVTVEYGVPVDLLVTEKTMNFKIKASSFIGRL